MHVLTILVREGSRYHASNGALYPDLMSFKISDENAKAAWEEIQPGQPVVAKFYAESLGALPAGKPAGEHVDMEWGSTPIFVALDCKNIVNATLSAE